jgi:hypothetical protein
MPRPHPEAGEEHQRRDADDDYAATPGEPDGRRRPSMNGHAHVGLPSDESNGISIEHPYELYRRGPAKFQDIFEQVFDHLATRR